jgi:ABC-type transporter Mla MlaB component
VLKISIRDSEEAVGLELEGKLVGPWVEELRRLSHEALSQKKSVTLDLGKVWFVDLRGVALLQELSRQRVSQINCSQFLSQQLKETV